MKIVSFCVIRQAEDEYIRGFTALQKRPDFVGIGYPDKGYSRMQACRLKPKFIADIFEEHAPFLYVDSDTTIRETPVIPPGIDIGVCQNPVMAEKGPPYNPKWIYSASCFYLSRSAAALAFVLRWNAAMRDKCGDHYPFMQAIKGATDITKYLDGKIEGFHKTRFEPDGKNFPVRFNAALREAGKQWI
jgi:hypothetical protein